MIIIFFLPIFKLVATSRHALYTKALKTVNLLIKYTAVCLCASEVFPLISFTQTENVIYSFHLNLITVNVLKI